MIGFAVAVLLIDIAQAGQVEAPCKSGAVECEPWQRDWSMGAGSQVDNNTARGPQLLIVSDGANITRLRYPTGARCVDARDSVRRQAESAPRVGVINGPPRVTAVCVPK